MRRPQLKTLLSRCGEHLREDRLDLIRAGESVDAAVTASLQAKPFAKVLDRVRVTWLRQTLGS